MRSPRRGLAILLAFAAAALAHPAPAAAHTHLRASSPANGATVDDTATTIRLTFSEPVVARVSSVTLLGPGGSVLSGSLSIEADSSQTVLTAAIPRLPPGAYVVWWRTTAQDGHVAHGELTFRVRATPAPAAGAPTTSGSGDTTSAAATTASPGDSAASEESGGDAMSDAASPLQVAVRWAEFLALLGMIGAVAFNLLVVRRVRGDASLDRVADRAAYGAWHLAAGAAALSILTLLARLWLQSRALYGADDAFNTDNLDGLIRGTVWGSGWILQAVATVAFFVGLMVSRAPHGRSPGWMGTAVAALLLAAVPALSGHAAAVERMTAVAIVSDWLHVLGAGVWLGTLAAVMLAGLPAAAFAGEGHGTIAFARIVGAFSPIALTGAATAGATGVISSLFHFHAVRELWSTSYGQTLLVKLALLSVVAGIGFYNWRYVLPSLHTSESPGRLRRTAGLELAVGLAVILVTAVLVALSPP
jgi:copper transport protein